MTDVCKLAGVSKATASRVLNGTTQVKESTRRAVFDAIDQLGYRPNSLADRRCDAIVLYSRFMSESQLAGLKAGLAIPLVVINRELPAELGPSVCFEQAGAARLMVNHLIGLGHRRIACITIPIRAPTGQARLEGYRAALGAHNIALDPQLIEHGDSHLEGGYLACRRLLERGAKFRALFAFNDDMAVGTLRALHEAGIRVPEQVSLAGFDNEPMSAYSRPPLTTVELPSRP
ncbi:substrate-binding domain-containing protein [Zobellella sp. An-6]|uniref:substrate-binding domain-containing protein n=1 Tax=Zobellella sp. An-6 TaxID=3400218 RepID=UPI004041F873